MIGGIGNSRHSFLLSAFILPIAGM